MKKWITIIGILTFGMTNVSFAQNFYGYNLADSLTITEISLRRKKLDTFPEELLHFKNLESLDLRNNKLDSIPDDIGQLKALKKIQLSRNQFETFPEPLKDLKQLEYIDLWDNSITDLNFGLETFPNLKYIDISGVLLVPEVYEELVERFKAIDFNSSAPCDCMYSNKKDK